MRELHVMDGNEPISLKAKKLLATEAALRAGTVLESLITDLKANEMLNVDWYRIVTGAVVMIAGAMISLLTRHDVIGLLIFIAGLLVLSTVSNALKDLHGFIAYVEEHRKHTQAMLSRDVYAPSEDIKLDDVIENLGEVCELCEKLENRRGFPKAFRDRVSSTKHTLADYNYELSSLKARKTLP